MKLKKFASAVSVSFLNLIYHGAGTYGCLSPAAYCHAVQTSRNEKSFKNIRTSLSVSLSLSLSLSLVKGNSNVWQLTCLLKSETLKILTLEPIFLSKAG